MDPIFNAPNTTKAIEVLFFDEAEVTKTRGGKPSFATFGPMSVLYFPSYHRFALQINDWRYPLLRRTNFTGSNGTYALPGPNGSTFDLKLTKAPQGFANLDAFFDGSRKLEASPDDKLFRAEKKHADTGFKEVITENIKHVVKKVQNKAATVKTGTKYLTSTKKRIDMKGLKNKNFKKEAHSKLKKDFFESSKKLTTDFAEKRKGHFTFHPKQFDDFSKVNAAVFYIPKEEVEEAILKNKDMFAQVEKKAFTDVGRDRIAPAHTEKTPIVEGMTHYQG